MEISNRMRELFERSRARAKSPPASTYSYDIHNFARTKYKDCPRWEKIARSTAAAIENQAIYIDREDRLIGRVYYDREKRPEAPDPDFDFNMQMIAETKNDHPWYDELARNQLACYGSPGHIAWDWSTLLRYGTEGIRRRCASGLIRHADDTESVNFYNGVLIMLEGLENWNDKHVAELEKMGKTEEAEICRRVPRYPARSFREAVQSFFMQFIVVMKENPYGGNSPGRLDYYLWPYLENDLKNGVCTMEYARELIEELFIRIDERLYSRDGWVESVVVGGCHSNGQSAVNPLSHIMIEVFMKYDITHPHIYARIPPNAPKDFLTLCADYVVNGGNRAQLLNDEAIMKALVLNGVSENDAADYYCGGCMEVGVQGKTSDFLFTGYQNIPMLLELCMTGGISLRSGKPLEYFSHPALTEFHFFEDFYSSFIAEAKRVLWANLQYQDRLSAHVEVSRPGFLISSMVDNCLNVGRNMHGGGARYHDYGSSFIGIPNTADSLYAVKVAIFDKKMCTAQELLDALKADFEGYEELRAKLLKIPKFGQEDPEADGMAARLTEDLCNIYSSYVNRFGGNGKPVILSFRWATSAGSILGATPDGRKAGTPLAQAVTPQGMAMTKGITAAMNSCTTLPFELLSGGASTMWDLDHQWATVPVTEALFTSFFKQGGHIFQGNVTDVETLIKAQQSPEDYNHVIVRVGGFSARFVGLTKDLQDDIINRIRHCC
ncbi:MAG: hypothetical protein IKB34_05405 [Clostridia bacterium]|nr:hypothetical protein [Clostridia bacterium]